MLLHFFFSQIRLHFTLQINDNILQKNYHSEKTQGVSLNVSYLICTYYIELNNLYSIWPKVY